MSQLVALYQLQQIDLQRARSQKRLEAIETALQDNQAVQSAQEAADQIERQLNPVRARVRDLELEIQSTRQKAVDTDERLYSGRVNNPKELQEMQQEIAALKRRQQELEDRLLDDMMTVESLDGQMEDAKRALQTAVAGWEQQNAALLGEKRQLQEQVAQLQARRKESLTHIAPDALKTYEALRPRKGNQPVAVLKGRSCQTCGIEQTLAIETETRRGQTFTYCLNCGRLLIDSSMISERD
jgi:hypothetical protein